MAELPLIVYPQTNAVPHRHEVHVPHAGGCCEFYVIPSDTHDAHCVSATMRLRWPYGELPTQPRDGLNMEDGWWWLCALHAAEKVRQEGWPTEPIPVSEFKRVAFGHPNLRTATWTSGPTPRPRPVYVYKRQRRQWVQPKPDSDDLELDEPDDWSARPVLGSDPDWDRYLDSKDTT